MSFSSGELCLRYLLSSGKQPVPIPPLETMVNVIMVAAQARSAPGAISFLLPSLRPAPCGDINFRMFASAVLSRIPGIPFYVLGGGSEFSRELLLAVLPNVHVVGDMGGNVLARYSAGEAQEILFHQFNGMLFRGVHETDAIREMTLLSKAIGMEADSWL
jgi:hypothetical protein